MYNTLGSKKCVSSTSWVAYLIVPTSSPARMIAFLCKCVLLSGRPNKVGPAETWVAGKYSDLCKAF